VQLRYALPAPGLLLMYGVNLVLLPAPCQQLVGAGLGAVLPAWPTARG
jgi:hypothetical protein